MKNKIYAVLMIVFLLAGIGVLAYPVVSEYVNTYQYYGTANRYVKDSQEIPKSEYGTAMEEAQEYNKWIAQFSSLQAAVWAEYERDSHTYEKLLSLDVSRVMGVIAIPDLKIYLPIYHGTEENALQKGVGHYRGSSLPIGGENTHAVVTGHTGLASAEIFTPIDTMKTDDVFYLYVLGETLKYKVDQISVVKPEDVEQLAVEKGKDYVTLVTCTPYGVNSHRLLVRGTRVPFTEDVNFDELADKDKEPYTVICAVVVAASMAVLWLLGFICGKRKNK